METSFKEDLAQRIKSLNFMKQRASDLEKKQDALFDKYMKAGRDLADLKEKIAEKQKEMNSLIFQQKLEKNEIPLQAEDPSASQESQRAPRVHSEVEMFLQQQCSQPAKTDGRDSQPSLKRSRNHSEDALEGIQESSQPPRKIEKSIPDNKSKDSEKKTINSNKAGNSEILIKHGKNVLVNQSASTSSLEDVMGVVSNTASPKIEKPLISFSYADKLKPKPSINSLKGTFLELPMIGLSEDEFLNKYKEVYDLLMAGNNATSEQMFVTEYCSVYPRVVAMKVSPPLLKSFYEMGFLDRVYFKEISEISSLPEPIKEAASTFSEKKVKFLKIFHVAPEYQQWSYRLVKIGLATTPVEVIIKKSQPVKIPDFNKEMVADRRANSLAFYAKELENEIEINQAAEFGISRQLTIISRRRQQMKPGTISQLKAFAREIRMNQIPSSNETKIKLCQLWKKRHGDEGRCLLCLQESTENQK